MSEVFSIVPAPARTVWILGGICILLTLLTALLAYVAHSCRNNRIEVSSEGLRIVGDLWGRTVPLRAIDVAGARVVDVDGASGYRPKWRTLGTGLPGYATGWFRLHNGEKALVYRTTARQVAYLPTRDGYALLLGVEQPGDLIEAVRRRAPPR